MNRLCRALLIALAPAAMLAASAASAQTAVTPEVRGKRLFLRCRACHAVEPTAGNKIGPNLHGVMGRKAAAIPGFKFSAPLTKAGLTWNDKTMDAWLKKPSAVVPGTTMVFEGMPKPEDRAALIAYLKTLR